MDGSIVYIILIIFIVLVLNFYFVFSRMRNEKRRSKRYRVAPEERKQAIWRDKEIARRIAREEEDALERFKLRNETLALYDEVRRRAAARETEGTLISNKDWQSMDKDDIERFR